MSNNEWSQQCSCEGCDKQATRRVIDYPLYIQTLYLCPLHHKIWRENTPLVLKRKTQ
jgi:hypothetical protein